MVPILYTCADYGKITSLLSRSLPDYDGAAETVEKIIKDIKERGDSALFEYTETFDKHVLTADTIVVGQEETEEAYRAVDERLLNVIRKASSRIRTFHEKQRRNSWLETSENGEIMGQMLRPLESVGVYVPGGKAVYPSSVLMNVVPAKVAGVKNIIVATPAGKDGKVSPAVLVAAAEAGAGTVLKIGGAQAVAAMAFGTASVPRVDKIVGPGNIYVALAKRAVYGYCDIDSVAGPSEILIIADESANPTFVAADMLSQAEHDELAKAVLVTNSEELAGLVQAELEVQTERLDRKDIIKKSLESYGAVIVTKTIEEAARISDQMAPEHLELCVKEPFSLLPAIKNAGAVFLGHYSPEPLGDYMAGPNHVLPTSGTARFFSPLSVDDFIKKSSVISFSRDALMELSEDIIYFAEAEGLTAHANAIKVREGAK